MAVNAANGVLSYEEWNEKFGNIDGKFSHYFKDNALSDVTFLLCGGKRRVPAHKFILSSCSWELYTIFRCIRFDHNEVRIDSTTLDTFLSFLEFCYKGQVNLKKNDAWSVLKLAYRFNVKHLITICEAFLSDLVDWDNCLEFYTKIKALREDTALQMQTLDLMQKHFDEILLNRRCMEIFLHLPVDAIEEISSLENFQCDEILLFNGLVMWAQHTCRKQKISCDPKNLRSALKNAFYEIRFPVMGMEWFTEILVKYPDLVTTHETSRILRFIRKEADDCPGFKHTFRKCSINHPKHFVKDQSTFVECFQCGPEKTTIFSSEMSIRFKCDTARILQGFGVFVSKANRMPKIISLHLKRGKPPNEMTKVCKVNSRLSKYFALQSDYGFRQEILQWGQALVANQWYTLRCNFVVELPILLVSSLKTFDENHGITFKKEQCEAIPYLIVK